MQDELQRGRVEENANGGGRVHREGGGAVREGGETGMEGSGGGCYFCALADSPPVPL